MQRTHINTDDARTFSVGIGGDFQSLLEREPLRSNDRGLLSYNIDTGVAWHRAPAVLGFAYTAEKRNPTLIAHHLPCPSVLFIRRGSCRPPDGAVGMISSTRPTYRRTTRLESADCSDASFYDQALCPYVYAALTMSGIEQIGVIEWVRRGSRADQPNGLRYLAI